MQPIGGVAPELTARFRDPGGNVIGFSKAKNESKSKAADKACPERSRRECPLHTSENLVNTLSMSLFLQLYDSPQDISFEKCPVYPLRFDILDI